MGRGNAGSAAGLDSSGLEALRRPRIGILGGAFDPPHLGHLALAKGAIANLGLDRLIILPTGNATHKKVKTTAENRLTLARTAFQGLAKAEVSDYEIAKGTPSYTVETLEDLQPSLDGQLFFIIGGDEYQSFLSWRDPQGVLERAILAVGERPGISHSSLDAVTAALAEQNLDKRVVFFDAELVDVASRELRSDFSSSGLLDPRVAEEIKRLELYRD